MASINFKYLETVRLNYDNGTKAKFKFLDLIQLENENYIVLLPDDGNGDIVQIYKLENMESKSTLRYLPLEDKEVESKVLDTYNKGKNNYHKKRKKGLAIFAIIMILIPVIIITPITIFNVTSNQREVLSVETNNGYKTFNFTIDEILKAYKITQEDTISNSEAPYCKEHQGTECLTLPIDSQYVDISVVYERKTRKVISIDTIQSLEKEKYFLVGVDKSDMFEKSYNYILEKTENVFDIIGKGDKLREQSLENQVLETKKFISIIEESKLRQLEGGEELDVNEFNGDEVGFYQLTRR